MLKLDTKKNCVYIAEDWAGVYPLSLSQVANCDGLGSCPNTMYSPVSTPQIGSILIQGCSRIFHQTTRGVYDF